VRDYQNWVEKYDGVVSKCKVKFMNKYQHYLVASETIKKGEIVVAIPSGLWLPLERLFETSSLLAELNKHGNLVHNLSSPWRTSFYALWYAE
jgi:hypothetical protein